MAPMLLAVLAAAAVSAPDLSWLRGEWLSCAPSEVVEEHWIDAGPTGLVGATVTRRGDQSSYELARITFHEGGWAFLASPGGRQPPTPFRLTTSEPGTLVFENPAHDFPQRIRYRRVGETVEVFAGDLQDQGPRWTYRRRAPGGGCPP